MRNPTTTVSRLTLLLLTAIVPACEGDKKMSEEAAEEEECEPGTNCTCMPVGEGTKVCDPMTHAFVMCDCSKAGQPITPPTTPTGTTMPTMPTIPTTPPVTAPVSGAGAPAVAGTGSPTAGIGAAGAVAGTGTAGTGTAGAGAAGGTATAGGGAGASGAVAGASGAAAGRGAGGAAAGSGATAGRGMGGRGF